MKIGILSNYGIGHVGGSEFCIENIAKILVSNYNYEVNTYNFNTECQQVINNINVIPCAKNNKLIEQINSNTHCFIYSDSFWSLPFIFDNISKIKPKITLALVGAYFLQTHLEYFKILKENINKFNLIVHSDTPDYIFCVKNKLPVSVIPNGVNLSLFKSNKLKFRKKYKIKEKYIILNVSQFFFGKNQYILDKISKELRKKRDDFIFVQISGSIKYPYEKTFLDRAKRAFNNEKCLFLRNIPREDVISAFKNSDIFCFVSGKEVFPIVILESRAAKLPWISLEVGNVFSQQGGKIIHALNKDEKGYKIIDENVIENYVRSIEEILNDQELKKRLISYGQKNIEQLDWKNIVPKYNEVFKRL